MRLSLKRDNLVPGVNSPIPSRHISPLPPPPLSMLQSRDSVPELGSTMTTATETRTSSQNINSRYCNQFVTFRPSILISPPKENMFDHSYLKIPLFICRARSLKFSKLAVIWTHERAVRGMGLVSTLRNKLLCNAKFLSKLKCNAVCDIKSRVDPWLSHHDRGFKLLQVLPSVRGLHGTEKAKFWVAMLTCVCFGWRDQC